jgi:hypothetical protein
MAARAQQLLEQVEAIAATMPGREAAFHGIFGPGGLYVTALPTLEDRMAFRDVPRAREKLFSLLGHRPRGGALPPPDACGGASVRVE